MNSKIVFFFSFKIFQKNLYLKPFTNKIHGLLKKHWNVQKNKGLPMKCNRCDFSDLSEVEIVKHYTESCPLMPILSAVSYLFSLILCDLLFEICKCN